jgi:putative ABC transport system permease protein
MSTTLLERPVEPAAGSGTRHARRAVVRWAWRLFRREWRQQLLVLALLTTAVAATVLGAAVATNTPPPRNAGFGTANHLITLPGTDPHLAADIEAVRQHFGGVDVIANQLISTGIVRGTRLRAQDPHGRYGYPMVALVSGRYPAGPNEVAMTGELAATFNLHVGEVWQQSGRARNVVGLVENPQNLLDDFALVAPGQLDSPSQVTVLFDATREAVEAFPTPAGATIQRPQPPQGIDPAVIVLLFAVFGLVFVGLVAVAGFSVLAQRRLRALGMLSSLGATDRHVRLVMVANGGVVGVVAAVLGTVLGFAGWLAYAPHLQATTYHRVVWTALPWWLIVTAPVLAVVTSVLAARRPARTVARLSVVAALSGRPAPPKPGHRSALPGLILLATGPILLALSGGWGTNGTRNLLLKLGGLLATAIGLLLLALVCVTLLGAVARRAPVAVRLALRDLARYRARSGAALAAISFAVLTAMFIGLLATGRYADPVDYFGPNLPANQLIVYPPDAGPSKGRPDPTATQSAGDLEAVANNIAATLSSHDVLALETTNGQLAKITHNGILVYPGTAYLATPAVLRHYRVDPGAIDPTALFLTSRPGLEGTAGLGLLYGEPDPGGSGSLIGPGDPGRPACARGSCVINPKIQTIDRLPTGTSDPNLLVTPYAVDTLKLRAHPAGWLIQTGRPLSAVQINAARQAAAAAGMTIETKSQAPSLSELRDTATAAGILLALAVLAMTVGLIRSETASDLQTLTATGASGVTRRNITAATTGALGLTGALLGTAVAYLATVALFRSQLSERMSEVPVVDLAVVIIGLPVLATAGSWLLAGREPPAIAHQPIE